MTLDDQLARVSWVSLKHAYGQAADLPALLKQRASANQDEARAAAEQLWSTVWHQGTVYEASAPAVPVLAAIAGGRNTVDRLDVLLLLSSIATGTSGAQVHGTGGADRVREELQWVREARQAVAKAVSSMAASLSAEPREVRLGLAVLATVVPEAGRIWLGDLRREFQSAPTLEERQLYASTLLVLDTRDDSYLEALSLLQSDAHAGAHLGDDAMDGLQRIMRGDAPTGHDLAFDLAARAADAVSKDTRGPG